MNFFTCWRLRRRAIRQNKKWRNSLKARTNHEYIKHWNSHNLNIDHELVRDIAIIMRLPNAHLYPNDKLSDILFNPFLDLSDVESILLIEKKLGMEINKNDIYLIDIFLKNTS